MSRLQLNCNDDSGHCSSSRKVCPLPSLASSVSSHKVCLSSWPQTYKQSSVCALHAASCTLYSACCTFFGAVCALCTVLYALPCSMYSYISPAACTVIVSFKMTRAWAVSKSQACRSRRRECRLRLFLVNSCCSGTIYIAAEWHSPTQLLSGILLHSC